ncbi:MAG: DUF4276 family protein [Salinispira sp.]
MVKNGVTIYVEGGGDSDLLKSKCRKGFSKFFGTAGFADKMPRIMPSGSRNETYDAFCTAVSARNIALLLVDSEGAVKDIHQKGDVRQWKPWDHLFHRDNWERPDQAVDSNCHLMVQSMESWFIADRLALKDFFKRDFKENKLPDEANQIETLDRKELLKALENATAGCQKGTYHKGKHSFKLLASINPQKIASASPWAKRLVSTLKKYMNEGT